MKMLKLFIVSVLITIVSSQCTTINNCDQCNIDPYIMCDDCSDGYGGNGNIECIACAVPNCK